MKVLEPVRKVLEPALALLLAAGGCAGLSPAPGGGACPVVPVASSRLAGPQLLRARVQIEAGEHSLRLESVAEISERGVVMLGFTPYGVRLFAVHQRERELSTEGLVDSQLRRPALWTADLLHRVFWIQPPGEAEPDGATQWSREGEHVTEWRKQGRIRRREFAREGAGADDSDRVSIDYPDDPGTIGEAGIQIRNPWCGYDAVVVLLEDRGREQAGGEGDAQQPGSGEREGK